LEKGGDADATLAVLKTASEIQARAGAPCVYDLILRLRDIAEKQKVDLKKSNDDKALCSSHSAGGTDIETASRDPHKTLARKPTEPTTVTSSDSVTKESCDFVVALLLIDHMRERVKYMKWISQSCQALGITGHIFGFRRHFFLVLEGESPAIQRCALSPEWLIFVFYSQFVALYVILDISTLCSEF
jgi:hypothetical protein